MSLDFDLSFQSTYRFAILAMSLSNLFDIQTAPDFLRGVLLTLAEFDQFQDENFKPKMVCYTYCAVGMLNSPFSSVFSVFQDNKNDKREASMISRFLRLPKPHI